MCRHKRTQCNLPNNEQYIQLLKCKQTTLIRGLWSVNTNYYNQPCKRHEAIINFEKICLL